ncbi:hypothetical protein LOK49_LG05G01921 [Camellia lanceoleosa]|uniref:Uncharacterized protein n=1 Tax=Camellia lanceoleosa TaxID=1840588 RepID=A0ACC0HU48_9ERIC|nr:hypothetical protein LOK49_LG05G01921 [Camellia lanceoleosa]
MDSLTAHATIELEEGSDESIDNSSLCLIGKILTQKVLNKPAVSRIIQNAWKVRKEVAISPLADNVYLFRFENAEDRQKVLRETPWSIMGNLLVLQALVTGSSISEIEFSRCPFWVQVHGLPIDRMTRRNSQIIASSIGNLIGVEAPHNGLLLYYSFLRIRVNIDVIKPLPRGFHLRRKDPVTSKVSKKLVDYKYERLSKFCYDCGRIGHDNQSCKFVTHKARRQSGYGPNLRTGAASMFGLPPEYYHRLIDEMEANLRLLLWQTPTLATVTENPTLATYFVTEPTESPPSIPSPPSGFSQCLSPPFDSSPTPSPSSSPKNISLYANTIPTTLLSHVFNGLSLKRKAQKDVHQAQFLPKLLKLTSETTVDSSQSITNQKSLAIRPYKSRVRCAPIKKRNSKPNPDPDLADVTIHNDTTISSFLHSSQIVVQPASLELHGEDLCSQVPSTYLPPNANEIS